MHALTTFLAGLLRGGRQPRHLFLAIVLGFTAGAVCGWNLTFAAIVCLAALLNCSTSLLACSAVCGLLAAYFGASVSRSFGVLILDRCGLGEQLAKLGDGPFPALFGLDDYQTCGALAAGIAISLPAAQVFSRFTAHRRSLLNLTVEANTDQREPLLRPLGFAAALCCTLLAAAGVQVQGPRLVGKSLLEHLSAALQTEVTADDVAYDLWSGDLRMTNLRVADAERPTDIALVVEQVTARVEPGLLLRGRFDCRDMTVAGLFCDPTKLSQAAPVGMFVKGPTLLKEDHLQPSHNEDPSRPVEIQSLVRNWSGVGDRLLVVQRLVTFVERISDLEATNATNGALKSCVESRRSPRDPISATAIPLVQVRNIKIDRLPSSWKLSPLSGLTLTDLTSCPTLASRPTKLAFSDFERRVTLETTFQLTSLERKHTATFAAQDVEVESLISTAATRNALEPLAGGTTSIEARGWITRELVHLDLTTELNGLQVAKSSGPLAGIDAAVWRQGLAQVDAVKLDAEITGRWSNPKLSFVPHEFVQAFKTSLAAAGAKEAVAALEKHKLPTSTNAAQPQASTSALAATTPGATASKSLVPPAATALMPKPNLPAAANVPAAARTTTANVPPMQPFTIQPMAMNPASIIATNVASPSITLPNSPNALVTNAALPPFAPTSVGLTPLTPAASPVAATAAIPTTPLKSLPTGTINAVAGEPWKEPSVVLGAPALTSGVAASTANAPATIAAAALTPNLKNDAAKSGDSTNSTSSYPQEIASETSPTMGVPQPNAVAKATSVPNLTDPSKPATNAAASTADAPAAKKPSTVAQIPTSAEAVAGLRQPLSVLDPNATPGPINLTVGYDSERTAASPAGGVQAATTNGARTPNRPSGAQGESREEQVVAARTSGRAAPSAALETPNRNDLERRDEATSDNSARPARLPAKPPVADQGRTAQREIEDIQSEPDSEPAPKKKSLLGNVTGWIGAKLNDQPNETDELQAENSPRYEETPESKKPAKKMFPRIRALFGEAPEMLPPDDAQLQVDRDVVPSKAEEIDSANKVRTSGFDAAAREQDEAGAPRPLNLPRTNEAGGGEAKPLAETRTFTEAKSVDTERPIAPSAAAQRPARFTSAVNAEAPEATVEKTAAQPAKTTSGQSSPTSRPAPKSTERLSAGESFYNRMVR